MATSLRTEMLYLRRRKRIRRRRRAIDKLRKLI